MILLEQLIASGKRLTVLTGAGISAASGIPTYRDDAGNWLHSKPIQHQEFIDKPRARQRYWARSMIGWQRVGAAVPNAGHIALAQLEDVGAIELLVTQNVDRLHQRAGHSNVVDLHGRLDRALCLDCGAVVERSELQTRLLALNPAISATCEASDARPDGDANLAEAAIATVVVPNCDSCGGTLMPDVVFFGGSVPLERVDRVNAAIEASNGLLVVGSSLQVFSGFRFCRAANKLNKPLFIMNKGHTRADAMATEKFSDDCVASLSALARKFSAL